MKEYITRHIKSKYKNNYKYEYLDHRNNHIDKYIVKKLIDGLYIPPAYDDVKINLNQNEKVLAIGYDEKQRPQYIYNKKFTASRSKKKYKKLKVLK